MNTNGVIVAVQDTLARSQTAGTTPQGKRTLPRLADVAASLTQVGVASATAELLNSALQHVIELAYATDTDTRWCNIDIDGRIRFAPLPWTRDGARRWGLRRREGDILRGILMARQTPKAGSALPLLTWDSVGRHWSVNVADYPSMDSAYAWVRKFGITSREYKAHLERAQKAERRHP